MNPSLTPKGRAACSPARGKIAASGSPAQRWVGRLTGTHPEFSEPFGFVLAVNDAALETEEFSNVAVVVADVLPGGLGVLPYPMLNIWRLAENVSSVPGLRHLNDHGLLEIENVFIAKDVHGPRTPIEMLVVVRVVIGAPVDLCDIKVAW